MRKQRDDEAELEIEFFRVKVKGGNSTVEEAIKQAANVALGRAVANRRNEAQALPPAKNTDKSDGQQSLGFDDVEEGEIVDSGSGSKTTAAKSSSSSKPRDKRVYPTPDILHDLDLKTGTVPFELFCKGKNPTSDNKKYLVIATWLKEHGKVNTITTAHIYTCYRAMSWTDYPSDWKQAFRNCKTQGWFRSTSTDNWEINHLGLEVVNKMSGGA